jgi:hypothetical protein
MRQLLSITLAIFLLLGATPSVADTAALVDKAVMVNRDPLEGNGIATYLSTGGYAVTSNEYVDAVGLSFDLGSTASVAQATLRLPIDAEYPLFGSVPIVVYGFADNGQIDRTDYSIGFSVPVEEAEISGLSELVLDVTGITNAILKSSQYAGFRIVSGFGPDDIPDDAYPAFRGVQFNDSGYVLDFTPGPAPAPVKTSPTYDGFTLATPNIKIQGFGTFYAELQLVDPNNDTYKLTVVDDVETLNAGPAVSGVDLLNCDAFDPPAGLDGFANAQSSYTVISGLLDIAQSNFDGEQVAVVLEYIEGSDLLFRLVSFEKLDVSANLNSVSALGGGTTIEPTQDFIPLCHGWVLIGDSSSNRLVERNIISGETGGSYMFNTKPDQLTLDDENNIVYFSTHPETERMYKLDLDMGVISYNRIIEGDKQYSPKDMVLGEDGNVFAILHDRHMAEPLDPNEPTADEGLWLGYIDGDANPVFPSAPLASPIRIEYDSDFNRIFLTTESNLATFTFDPETNSFAFVDGTDIPIGSGCTDFDVSPNGKRLAYACPNGNTEEFEHFAIHDLDPMDYYNPDGEWYLGAPPVSATFSSEGDLLIATDGSKLFFFDVVTHIPLQTYDLGFLESEVVDRIRLSRDGEILLVFIENELDAANGKMYWMQMPDISGTPDF